MIRIAARLFLCAFVLSAVAYGEAATTFYGTTQGHPTFNHPSSLSTLSGDFSRFDYQPFKVNQNAHCFFQSVQDTTGFDGMLFLYRNGFNSASPLSNLIALDDDDDDTYGIGTSRIDSIQLFANNDYFLVTAGYNNGDFGTFTNTITCDEPATRVLVGYGQFGDNTASAYDGRYAQLGNGRFEVSVSGFNFASTPFVGRTAPLASNDSALFYFFTAANFELLVKVVDGCALNSRFWIFYAATTNVDFTLKVTDTFIPGPFNYITYHNPLGTQLATSVADTDAFDTCF
jgi:hypothetical protein